MTFQSALVKKHTKLIYELVLDSIDYKTKSRNSFTLEETFFIKKRIVAYLRQNIFDAAKFMRNSRMKSEAPNCNSTHRDVTLTPTADISANEYTIIWKYSFLSLAVLMGILSILLILVLVYRIIR